MEFDTITIEPVLLNWFLLCIPFYIAGLIIAVALFCGIATQWNMPDTLSVVLSFVLSVLFLASVATGIAFTSAVAQDITETTVLEHQITALEDQLGYTHIEVKQHDANNTFVASTADGQYVSGKLVESDTDTFIVVLTQ